MSADAEAALGAVRAAIASYHRALDQRQHGSVAASIAINAIEDALDMHWRPAQPGEVCGNCETRLPEGCGGAFLSEQQCLLAQKVKAP